MPSTSSIFHFLPNTPSTSSPFPTHSDLPPILNFQHPSPHYFSASSSSPRSLGHLWHYALSFIFPSSITGHLCHYAFSFIFPSSITGHLWHYALSFIFPSLISGHLWHYALTLIFLSSLWVTYGTMLSALSPPLRSQVKGKGRQGQQTGRVPSGRCSVGGVDLLRKK